MRARETIMIGAKTTTARGTRYLTQNDYERQLAAGLLEVIREDSDSQGALKKVHVESVRYVESDTAVVNRVLGRQVGGKKNILVLNDEAHHAYRIRRPDAEAGEESLFGEQDEDDEFFREATVWVEGLDRIHTLGASTSAWTCLQRPTTSAASGRIPTGPFPGLSAISA